MRLRDSHRWAAFAVVLSLVLALAPLFATSQGAPSRAQQAQTTSSEVAAASSFVTLPKACWPADQLRGRDTVYAYLPCNSLNVLPPGMRVAVECTLDRLKKGGWDPIVFETYRSDKRQQILYSYGRTRPGSIVTNARDATTGLHFYRLGVDIIHRKKLWSHPRFFYWVGQHAETCGLVAGAFWKRLPDAPHVQFGAWPGAPPQWARAIARDSIGVIWLRVGAAR